MLNSIIGSILATHRSEFAKIFMQFRMKSKDLCMTKLEAVGKTRPSDFWNNIPQLCN